jgi:hypothetical protein
MATLSIFISNVDDDTYDRSDHKGHDEWWGGVCLYSSPAR